MSMKQQQSKALGYASGAVNCMWISCNKICISGKKCLVLEWLVSAMELSGEPQGRFKGPDHHHCAIQHRNTSSSLGVVNNKKRNYSFLLYRGWSSFTPKTDEVWLFFFKNSSSWCFHIQLKKAFTEQLVLSWNPPGEDGSWFLNSLHLNGINAVWYWHNTSDRGFVYIVYLCKMLYIPWRETKPFTGFTPAQAVHKPVS